MQPLIVTVYVPLCSESCVFCDRLTTPSTLRTVARYRDALIAEIDSVASDVTEYEIVAIRFTGGVPLLLGGTNIADILFRMRNVMAVADDVEVTVETVPGKLDEHNLRMFSRVGVSRLEFELPTFVQSEHMQLRCPGLYAQIYDGDAMRRFLGPDDWGCNLTFGLPGQTLESWKRTLQKVIEMEPTHISIAEHRRFRADDGGERGSFVELSRGDSLALCEAAVESLSRAGYDEYVLGSFARPGYCCRYNELAYENADVLGIGAGVGSLYGGYAYRNTEDVEVYMAHSSDPEHVVCDVREVD